MEEIAPDDLLIDLTERGVHDVVKPTAERAATEIGDDDYQYVSSHDLRCRFAQRLRGGRARITENDVDPENPRPNGHYPRFRDNEWHYVPDELAQTISLGPSGDGEEGQDWVLTYTPEQRNEDDREKVLIRLTPRALHELYIGTKDLSNDARMYGHSAECDLCGEQVDLERAIPNPRGEPCHKHCWAEYTGAPEWFTDHAYENR